MARSVVPPFEVTCARSSDGSVSLCSARRIASGEGRIGEPTRVGRRESQLARRLLERLEEVEDVRRTAADDRGHRIELVLALAPQDAADRLEHCARRARPSLSTPESAYSAGDAGADQCRRVGHGAHQSAIARAASAKGPADECRRRWSSTTCRFEQRRQLARRAAHVLRLHGDDDDVGANRRSRFDGWRTSRRRSVPPRSPAHRRRARRPRQRRSTRWPRAIKLRR